MRAFELKEQGWKQIEIAKALGVYPRSREPVVPASQGWWREGGPAPSSRSGAYPTTPPRATGPPPQLLSKGAEYYGFIGEVWTG